MNRVFRKSVFQALRASITIAAGAGQRPEPVVRKHHKNPNPVGVEQGSSGILPESEGLQYRHDTPIPLPNSTPTGSMKILTPLNHGFRFTSPAAIIVMTPPGSIRGDDE
jgi:hypothetical protein